LIGSDPHKSLIFLHGDPKVGKSQFFSQFPDVYFIATEKGLNRLNVRKTYIDSWQEFKDIIRLMRKESRAGNFEAGYIVIDTADLLFHYCTVHVCDRLGIEGIADAKWGKGWSALGKEWIDNIAILCNIGPSIGFIGHSTEREVIVKGLATMQAVPEMQKKGFKTLNALCDYILHAKMERIGKGSTSKEKRMLYLRGTPEVMAGCRDELAPEKIEFSYKSFLAYCDEIDVTNTKPKKKKKKKKGVKNHV